MAMCKEISCFFLGMPHLSINLVSISRKLVDRDAMKQGKVRCAGIVL